MTENSTSAGRLDALGGVKFRPINPRDGNTVPPDFHQASEFEADAAAKAFAIYRTTSGAQRAQFLELIAEGIEQL